MREELRREVRRLDKMRSAMWGIKCGGLWIVLDCFVMELDVKNGLDERRWSDDWRLTGSRSMEASRGADWTPRCTEASLGDPASKTTSSCNWSINPIQTVILANVQIWFMSQRKMQRASAPKVRNSAEQISIETKRRIPGKMSESFGTLPYLERLWKTWRNAGELFLHNV